MARMGRKPWDYAWSSAREHVGERGERDIVDVAEWSKVVDHERWKALLVEKRKEDEEKKIKLHTRTGRPLGSDSFLSKLESKLGRRLRAFSVGRPKKSKRNN